MSFVETGERRALRAAVAKLGAGYGHEYFAGKARAGEHLTELWAAAGKLGYLGVNIPAEYGGGGGGMGELSLVLEELGAAGCPLLMMVVSPAICGSVIARFGTEAQRRRWLPGIADGSRVMAFAITEPDAGSNSHRLSTIGRRAGGDWILTGRKVFISGVDGADEVLVVGRIADDSVGTVGRVADDSVGTVGRVADDSDDSVGTVGRAADSMTGRLQPALFVVPRDAAGFEWRPIEMELVTPDRQYALFFDDVRLPGDALVGAAGAGLQQLFAGLNPERIMAAAFSVGIGRYALDRAVSYVKERSVWNAPIGAHQGLAHPLAQCKIELELARLMTQKAAFLYDQGQDMAAGEAANMAKYAAAEAGIRTIDQAVQSLGGNGLSTEYGLASLLTLSRVGRVAPVSREMILNFVARYSLGLPKSY
jgi:alkylation response protein AidB-like acyl-CoA dehydrogenase